MYFLTDFTQPRRMLPDFGRRQGEGEDGKAAAVVAVILVVVGIDSLRFSSFEQGKGAKCSEAPRN